MPITIARATGVREIRRSLATPDPDLAKRLCTLAKLWFDLSMADLQSTRNLNRSDLDEAARVLFERLALEVDRPRRLSSILPEAELAERLAAAENRVRELEDQLRRNMFGAELQPLADEIAVKAKVDPEGLSQRDATTLLKLAARAERLALLYLGHQLSQPWTAFEPDDPLAVVGPLQVPVASLSTEKSTETISPRIASDAVDAYLSWKALRVDSSQLDEIGRALNWFVDHVGADRPLDTIGKAELRAFRDGLERLDKTFRGRGEIKFADRQTHTQSNWIATVTSRRYLSAMKAFFVREVAEGHLQTDPSAGLTIEARKGEKSRTPEPFSTEELRRLFATPLYAGHASPKRVFSPGSLRSRGSYFWSGLLGLYTGMRAGEIAQLLGSDFDFSEQIATIKVRPEDGEGNVVKKTKTTSSVRTIPIAQVLLELGLRQLIDRRTKGRNIRVFRDIPLGSKDRKSDGLTKAWGRLLKAHGLHKPGRSFHVFRHTATAAMRRAQVREEVIGSVLGHAPMSVTGGYGGGFPLEALRQAIDQIDYGLEIVELLGGPFNPSAHL